MVTADAGAGQTSKILASLNSGAMIQIFYGPGEGVTPSQFPGTEQMVLSLVEGYPQTAVLAAYQFDGAMSAKAQIADQESDLFWQQGPDLPGLANPIVLGPPGGGFTLTDTGGGRLTLQTEQTPPPPFVRPGPVRGQSGFWFRSGFADPGSGSYMIQVVG